MTQTMKREWRTNIGLRLPIEIGKWFENECQERSRTYSNYVELLIRQQKIISENLKK